MNTTQEIPEQSKTFPNHATPPSTGNTVELATEVGRNKPAQAGVSGKLAGQMPETVASRPYSGLRQILNSTALPSTGPLLRLEGVRCGYREAGEWREILRGVDLVVDPGEQLALVGLSGSGKSTLLHLIGGLGIPSAGHIFIEGVDLTGLGEPALSLWRRSHVGFIFQFFNLIPTLNVLENVLLPLELNGISERKGRKTALDLLAEVGLADRAGAYPDRLSGGEQQCVAIVRALIHQPKLVLADEPTGNLDFATGEKVLDLLDRLVRALGKTLILITHSDKVVRRADRIIWLVDGRLDMAF